ncbi:MAG TPA: FecR domain-containing protein [Verrucomicrobiae bacterium]|nr:FecR domain-containing protein [Verrucomicrobiae bacterium]
MISAKRATSVFLCVLLSTLPVLGDPQAAGQHAGQIEAMIPAASRNDKPAKVKDELQWNDLLKTTKSGRVRAGLSDGSILSVGSDSQLRVVQHDAASQQTSLEMNYGKLRSQVEKITKQGGKFEVKTPNAVIGAIGTDFYVGFASNKTTVICYQGKVAVTPLGRVQVLQNSGQANSATNSITVSEGQMVVISSVIPPGGFQTSDTPPAVQQGTQLATDVPTNPPAGVRPGEVGHTGRWVFIGSAVAVGVAAGVLGTRSTGACSPNVAGRKCP